MTRQNLINELAKIPELTSSAVKYETLQYKYGGPLYCVEIHYVTQAGKKNWVRQNGHDGEDYVIGRALDELKEILEGRSPYKF